MKTSIYTMKCLTNMHVGNGDVNYNIIDNEVEKDTVTNNPMVYASSLKGALRQHFEDNKDERIDMNWVFGSSRSDSMENEGKTQRGEYKFFDARILARPLRVSCGNTPYILVTTFEQLLRYLKDLADFGVASDAPEDLAVRLKNDYCKDGFVKPEEAIEIEGETTNNTNELTEEDVAWIKGLLGGETYAITSDTFLQRFELPVLARNQLDDGKSKNLWYEEIVPHESVFYFMVLRPQTEKDHDLEFSTIVQVGGNASIGYGFTKITKIK